MTIEPETGLTLEEIASLADGEDLHFEAIKKLPALVRSHPRLAEPLAELRRLAEEAGGTSLRDAVDLHRDFDRLAAAQWRHPAEVLDPDVGICYPEMIAIASARAGKADGAERERLIGIRERLEQAHVEYRETEEFFDGVVDRLLTLDGDEAEKALCRLAEQHRFRRKNREQSAET